jgi:hypothetical protein
VLVVALALLVPRFSAFRLVTSGARPPCPECWVRNATDDYMVVS